jgi:hypothetical protein
VAVEAMEQAEALALLDTLFATSPVGLAYWDRELRYVRLNGCAGRDRRAADWGAPGPHRG